MSAEEIEILGVKVHPTDVDGLHERIAATIAKRERALVLNVNVHCLNLAYRNTWLRTLLNRAEIVFCDGAGVMLGARLLGRTIPDRITYADWMWQLAELCERNSLTMFFLGARQGTAAKAAAALRSRFPRLQIVGVRHGYFDKTPGSSENEAIIDVINATKPNILIVGFGMPMQEQWVMENWERLEVNVGLTGGACFDYISGELRRAPRWLTSNGFEWLGRLIIEPRRLWRRYLIGNWQFLWLVLRQRFGILRLEATD